MLSAAVAAAAAAADLSLHTGLSLFGRTCSPLRVRRNVGQVLGYLSVFPLCSFLLWGDLGPRGLGPQMGPTYKVTNACSLVSDQLFLSAPGMPFVGNISCRVCCPFVSLQVLLLPWAACCPQWGPHTHPPCLAPPGGTSLRHSHLRRQADATWN